MSNIKYFSWYAWLQLRQWLGVDKNQAKADLLASLRLEHAKLEAVFDQVPSMELDLPGVDGDWSVKDVLAHVPAWDRRGMQWIAAAAAGNMPEMPEPGLSWSATDDLNDRVVADCKALSVDELRSDFMQVHRDLVEMIEGLPESLVRNLMVAELVTWRYKHYQRHAESIRTWLEDRSYTL